MFSEVTNIVKQQKELWLEYVFCLKKKSWTAIACLDQKRNLRPGYALVTFLCTHLQGCINDKG